MGFFHNLRGLHFSTIVSVINNIIIIVRVFAGYPLVFQMIFATVNNVELTSAVVMLSKNKSICVSPYCSKFSLIVMVVESYQGTLCILIIAVRFITKCTEIQTAQKEKSLSFHSQLIDFHISDISPCRAMFSV